MSTDYSKVSDFEINLRVARIILSGNTISEIERTLTSSVFYENFQGIKTFDPCNNPADAWPVIVENNITIINDKNCFPRATNDSFLFINDQFDDCIHWCDRNPLKAAMIVFLMMQESKNAS